MFAGAGDVYAGVEVGVMWRRRVSHLSVLAPSSLTLPVLKLLSS